MAGLPRRSRIDRQGHVMIIECPFPHEADAVGNDAIDDEFGIVTHSEILAKQRVLFPDFVDKWLFAVIEGMS